MTTPARAAARAKPAVTPVGSPYPDSGSQTAAPTAKGSIRGSSSRMSSGPISRVSMPSAALRLHRSRQRRALVRAHREERPALDVPRVAAR